MSTKTETKHAGEFIMHEYPLHYCRNSRVVPSGQNLVDGQLVQLSGANIIAKNTTMNTAATAYTTAIEGIVIGNWDRTASGPDGAADTNLPVPYLARGPAIVREGSLTFPAGTPQKAVAITDLAAKGILVRNDG